MRMLGIPNAQRMISLIFALLQSPATVEPAPPAPVSDPAAVALLQTVAAAQFASKEGREVDAFEVGLVLKEFGDTPHEYGFGLTHTRRGGETVTIRINDPEREGVVSKGFDGRRYWLRHDEGPIQDLSAHEFAQDRASIDEALELSADLLLALDFASLSRSATGLKLAVGPELQSLISGEVRRGSHLWDFTLVLPAAAGPLGLLPSDLFLRQLNEDAETRVEKPVLLERQIAFTHYERFRERAAPRFVHEFLLGSDQPSRTLEVHTLLWEDKALAPVKGALQVGER